MIYYKKKEKKTFHFFWMVFI